MTQLESTDASIVHPDLDFLQAKEHAQRLATFLERIQLPFTLGVYGEWGEGKTSFVKLLVHYLKRRESWEGLTFIEFSAWPYLTSDAVWRALILRIAREMYDIPGEVDRVPEPAPPGGVLPAVKRLLQSEAMTILAPSREVSNNDLYRHLIAQVDRSAMALANRSRGSEIDQELALRGLSTVFLSAAGSFSPWLSGLQRLFGIGEAVDAKNLIRSGVGASKREVVESVEEIRSEIRKMFKHDQRKRLVVLIDDLDRCMPEVALDVLEMMKLFFFESSGANAQCLFVVAADQTLIGQGLRARFREAVEGETPEQAREFLGRKGLEYFEKIIQFGVRVPRCRDEQSHHFIAANFPTWSCATDILGAAIGSNPRRLKQQCNLLSYKHMVARKQDSK